MKYEIHIGETFDLVSQTNKSIKIITITDEQLAVIEIFANKRKDAELNTIYTINDCDFQIKPFFKAPDDLKKPSEYVSFEQHNIERYNVLINQIKEYKKHGIIDNIEELIAESQSLSAYLNGLKETGKTELNGIFNKEDM